MFVFSVYLALCASHAVLWISAVVNLNSLERDWLRQAEVCPRHTMMKKKRGSRKKRWEDNIKEWTGMDFASSTMAVENRTRWKGIVANSTVVPRRPSNVMG